MSKIRAYILSTLLVFAAVTTATEVPVDTFETLEAIDTIAQGEISAQDSVWEIPDPEWYVAPTIVQAPLRAPKRMSAASCDIDSIQTYNVDSVLTSVAVYEYGDTTRAMTWTVNSDGTRVGNSREESASTASSTYSATYAWDNTTGDWAGTSREEHYFAAGKDTAWLVYAWVNNAWVVDKKYTYVYDASGRETEFTTYERNAAGQLAYSKQRIREYNAAGTTTLDIQYTAHNGTAWSAGTKELWVFNGPSNKQTLHEKYSLTNGNWSVTLREIKGYDAAGNNDLIENYALQSNVWKGTKKEEYVFFSASKKTSSIVYTWSNGNWVYSTKEIWEFNGPSAKQTLHEKYGWSNGDWQITLQENTGFTGNNNTSVENYALQSNVWKGTKKEEYTYSGSTKISTITYKWSNNAWVNNVWTVSDKVSNPNESCKYNWSVTANVWIGNGNRTLTTNNSSKKPIEVITQVWPANATDWVNYSKKTTVYSGANTTQEATFTWSEEANDWVGTSRSDWHYNAQGKNDTIKTYTNNGTEWIYSNRTVKNYNAAGTEIMVHNAQWDGEKWVMTSMTRTDIVDVTIDGVRQVLNASWSCTGDSIWRGIQKDTAAYTASGKMLYSARFTSWANDDWVPSYQVGYVYDEAERILENQRWDWKNSSWQGTTWYTYAYNALGLEVSSSYYGSWNSTNGWIGTSKKETTYDDAGYIIAMTRYGWNYSNNTWKESNQYLYQYDVAGNTTEQVVQNYANNTWTNSIRYEKEYKGSILIKDNDYEWINDAWRFTRRNETYYDNDSQAKLRREINGYWSNGVVSSFTDNHYFYACDPKYTIRFVNYDGTALIEDQVLLEGAMPVVPADPTKPADAQYTYTFAGWDKPIVPVVGDETYTATFSSTINKYTITFKNGIDTLQSTEVEYGIVPTYNGATPTKPSDAQYTYTFADWDAEIVAVTGEATYNATFSNTTNTYTITFKNGTDTLQSTEVEYGVMPTYNGATPTKPADAQYTYAFAGWDAEPVAVVGEATYNATFSNTTNTYTITFKNGTDTLQSTEVEYGIVPTYNGVTPTKPSDAQYTYTFAGWDAEPVTVVGEATYNATFSNTTNTYTITFKNGTDTLQSTEVEYGVMPTYNGATPTKPSDVQYTYAFAGWDAEPVAVVGEATYNATFSNTTNTYTITFKNGTDTLQSTEVEYGVMPTYNGAAPTKPSDAQYTYAFAGWDAEIVAVTGEATYNATFSNTVNKYTIVFKNGTDTLQSTEVEYGVMPTYSGTTPTKPSDAQYTYTFAGWDAEIVAVTGEATYNATFSNTTNTYLVTFKNGTDTLQSTEVEYGIVPTYNGATPTKPSDAQYTYTFAGWDAEPVTVVGEATYNATFSNTTNKYTIVFKNGIDTLQSTEVEYGVIPTYNGATPTKPSDAQYTYTFAGWDAEPIAVVGEATYNATFSNTTNTYLVTFKNGTDTLQSTEVEYGVMPTYSGATPTKPSDTQYTYSFSGWDAEPVAVVGEATYNATFSSTQNSYTITWLNADGTLIEETIVEAGNAPAHANINKESTAQYTFVFKGWSPAIVPASGNATYTAVFDTVVNKYTVTFYYEDGITVIDRMEVAYGETPSTHYTPAKAQDDQYYYTFSGWTPEIVPVTGDAAYMATYDQVTREYEITFKNYNGRTLQTLNVAYGEVPEYTGDTPQRPETKQYRYEFTGWTPELTEVTGNATYTAVYTEIDKSQGLEDVQGNQIQSTKILRDNQIFILRGGKTYTLQGVEVEE